MLKAIRGQVNNPDRIICGRQFSITVNVRAKQIEIRAYLNPDRGLLCEGIQYIKSYPFYNQFKYLVRAFQPDFFYIMEEII